MRKRITKKEEANYRRAFVQQYLIAYERDDAVRFHMLDQVADGLDDMVTVNDCSVDELMGECVYG